MHFPPEIGEISHWMPEAIIRWVAVGKMGWTIVSTTLAEISSLSRKTFFSYFIMLPGYSTTITFIVVRWPKEWTDNHLEAILYMAKFFFSLPFPERSAVGPVLGLLPVTPLFRVQSNSSRLSWVNPHNDLLSKLQNTEKAGKKNEGFYMINSELKTTPKKLLPPELTRGSKTELKKSGDFEPWKNNLWYRASKGVISRLIFSCSMSKHFYRNRPRTLCD